MRPFWFRGVVYLKENRQIIHNQNNKNENEQVGKTENLCLSPLTKRSNSFSMKCIGHVILMDGRYFHNIICQNNMCKYVGIFLPQKI